MGVGLGRIKIMQKKRITITKEYLDAVKSERDHYKNDCEKVKIDRDKFREFYIMLLKQNVKMNSQKKYWSSETMITELSKLINRVEHWYWG